MFISRDPFSARVYPSCEQPAGQFPMHGKGRLAAKSGREHQGIRVARMVEHQHRMAAGNAVGTDRRERRAKRPQCIRAMRVTARQRAADAGISITVNHAIAKAPEMTSHHHTA
jgi:hypothetical protein